MKVQAIGLLLFLLQQSATAIPQQVLPKSSIEGSIIRLGTGEPIAGARVTVGITMRQQRTAISSQSGKYIINDLDAGDYLMTVTADGYSQQEYGQQSASGPGDRLTLAAGHALKGIDFVLVPSGYVSGRIRDKAGGPAVGLEVQLLQVHLQYGGSRSFRSVGRSTTNERGEYRFSSVNSGRYYVVARPRSGTPDDIQEGYTLTYYPGVVVLADATAIDLVPGQDLAAVDFTVYPQKMHRLRGSVIDQRTNRSPEAIRIELQHEPFAHEGISPPLNASYDATKGTFEIRNVASGSYTLEAEIPDKNRPDSGSPMATASVAVMVTDSNIDGLTVVAYPPTSIPGRLTVDGAELSTIRDLARIRVRLDSFESSSAQSQTVNADGTFRIDNVKPGQYQVMVCMSLQNNEAGCARSTPDFYVKICPIRSRRRPEYATAFCRFRPYTAGHCAQSETGSNRRHYDRRKTGAGPRHRSRAYSRSKSRPH
jgi:hypothetical protein